MSSSICCTCRCSSPGPIQDAHMTFRFILRSSSILCLNCRLYHNTFLFCDGFEIKRHPFVSVVCSFSPMLPLFKLSPFSHNLRYQADCLVLRPWKFDERAFIRYNINRTDVLYSNG